VPTGEIGLGVDHDDVLTLVHKTAAEFAASNGREVVPDTSSDNLLTGYGFSSLDALEYLLVLEEKFGITLEDEDLTEEVLSSASKLADYILTKNPA
jgi:acyl carrier protein